MTDAPQPGPTRYPTAADYPWLFRLLHWLLWPSTIILTLTGLSQHAVASPDWSLFWGVLPDFFWAGRVHLYHTWAALVFSPAVLAASWMYLRRRPRFRPVHLFLLGGSLLLLLSGLLLATWPGPMLVYLSARWVHAAVGLVVLPVAFLWHAAQGLTRYRRGLPVVFHPWASPGWWQLAAFVPVVLLTSCLILNGLPVRPAWRTLVAERIEPADVETGELDKLPWQQAPPLRLELAGGLGFQGGRTRVTLQALHDGGELFVRAQWCDPAEDRRDMPWAKTAHGWKHLVTDRDDETHYYEDKFSLIFPVRPDWQFERFGCAVQCHAGDAPSGAQRRYGYKASRQTVDVWHWKSTRTDPCGQVDDKYWSEVDDKNKDVGRYGDPKDSGGYSNNLSEDKTHPAFLTRDPWAVRHGMIPTDDAVPYDSPEGRSALERIPIGGIVPGIVASAAVGDRGDVSCTSHHRDGRWVLYIRRKLDTGSRFDVQFVPGRGQSFGCAAFDNSSKRHAYNLTTYWLDLRP